MALIMRVNLLMFILCQNIICHDEKAILFTIKLIIIIKIKYIATVMCTSPISSTICLVKSIEISYKGNSKKNSFPVRVIYLLFVCCDHRKILSRMAAPPIILQFSG